jgi:hypothetical protein
VGIAPGIAGVVADRDRLLGLFAPAVTPPGVAGSSARSAVQRGLTVSPAAIDAATAPIPGMRSFVAGSMRRPARVAWAT